MSKNEQVTGPECDGCSERGRDLREYVVAVHGSEELLRAEYCDGCAELAEMGWGDVTAIHAADAADPAGEVHGLGRVDFDDQEG